MDEQSINQEYIPPFKVISLEVPLIRTCIVKVQEGWEFRNIQKKGYCHRIECSTANFLIALMWKRPLNSVVLTTLMHRGTEEMSNGTSTQVVT